MKVDLTGMNQHGFKRKRSTKTAGLSIQSALARAIEQGKFAIMASLDLSSAFDLVNIKVLLTRLRQIGLPADVVNLVAIWLSNRFFYVNAKGNNSVRESKCPLPQHIVEHLEIYKSRHMPSLCISVYLVLSSSQWLLAKAFKLAALFIHYVTLNDMAYL